MQQYQQPSMAGLWTSLEVGWKLQDVQAGLNVVITTISFLASFIFIRLCWQRTASRVTSGSPVPLSSLLSVSTPGEVFDLVLLAHKKLFDTRHLNLFIQCIVVVGLSATAIFSGFLARYATRYGTLIRQQMVIGSVPDLGYGGMQILNVDANTTITKLNNASFPLNQLPEFLPDSSIDWRYDPSQWNSSWTMNCSMTPETVLNLTATGNCGSLWNEIPIAGALYSSAYEDGAQRYSAWTDANGIQDGLLFFYGYNYFSPNSFTVMLAAVHLHKPPTPTNKTCYFGKGPIQRTTMTKTVCFPNRLTGRESNVTEVFPNYDGFGEYLSISWMNYYTPTFLKQSLSKANVTIPSPEELIRFYQVYTLLKDTQTAWQLLRPLNVSISVVQVSTIFLAVASLVSLAILLGCLYYWSFLYRHRNIVFNVPQSKLDWMLQSVEAEDRPKVDAKGHSRLSVTVDYTRPVTGLSHSQRKQVEFEDAQLGHPEMPGWFKGNRSSAASISSTAPLAQDGTGIYHDQTYYDTAYSPFKFGRTAISGATYPLQTLAGYQSLNHRSNDYVVP